MRNQYQESKGKASDKTKQRKSERNRGTIIPPHQYAKYLQQQRTIKP